MPSKLLGLFSRSERAAAGGLLLMMALGAVLEVVGIGLIAPIIGMVADPDAALGYPAMRRLYELSGAASAGQFTLRLLFLFAALIVAKNLYLALLSVLQSRFVFGAQAALSRRLMAGHLFAPYAKQLERNTADVTRNFATEVNGLFAGVVLPLLALGAEVLVLILVVIGLLLVMPQAALLALCAGGLLVALAYAILRSRLVRHGRERAERSGRRLRAINEALGGLKELKVLGVERHFLRQFESANDGYLEASRAYVVLNAMPRLLVESLAVVVLVGTGIALASASPDARSALPSLALLCAGMLRLMPAVTRILAAMASIRFYAPVLDQIRRDLALYAGVEERATPPTGGRLRLEQALEVRSLHFAYGAAAPTLQDVSLVIPAGTICGLVGTSGAGKSTLADLILGLLEPQRGSILVDGVDIRERMADWRQSIGYVPQTVHLLDDSVRRNVAFGLADAEIDDAKVWAALRAAQLDEIVRERPGGLDGVAGERGVRLSGGQRQRLGIARALYRDPQVLVLDEPTSALDLPTESAVADALFALRGTRTVIVIAHRLETIRRCDQVVFIADGAVQAQGSLDGLIAQNQAFAALVGRGAL